MRRCVTVALIALCALQTAAAQTDPPATLRYPRVYGNTGRPYGPTQAHYQYQRRYGRAWDGYGGDSIRQSDWPDRGYAYAAPRGYYLPPYGFGWGYSSGWFDPRCGCQPLPLLGGGLSINIMPPLTRGWYPDPTSPSPEVYQNDALWSAWKDSQERWQTPLDPDSLPGIAPQVITPSTADAKLRSVRAQARGDEWFRQQQYVQAHERYEDAVTLAQDRGEAWLRKGLALAAIGQFDGASRDIKRAVEVDPTLPARGEGLDAVFGPENVLAKTALEHQVADWVQADIRDPRRLFLMGALLHFDGYGEKAAPFFEAALRLAGYGEHLVAFLNSPDEAPLPDQLPNAAPGDFGGTPTNPTAPGRPTPVPSAPEPANSPAGAGQGFELPVPPVPEPSEPDGNFVAPVLPQHRAPAERGPLLLAPGA